MMDERRERILEKLMSAGSVYVSDLAQDFSVTYETIRKDLAYLEEQGYLVKSHGGATLKQGGVENPFQVRERENIEAKAALAKCALEMIPDGSSIILSTGSTVLELAKLLTRKSGLKVFTDSLPVAATLMNSNNQVFFFGGQLRSQSSSVAGGWTVSQIRQIKVDLCFFGTDGFSNLDGPSSPSSSDAFIDQEIIAHSEKRYVLADLSKFMRKSLYRVCGWEDIDALITNKGADRRAVESIETKTKVILC